MIRFPLAIAVVAVVWVALVQTTLAATKATRSCGTLASGIGWHLRASS